MSSAALQTAHHHQPVALTPPLLASSPAIPYSSSHSSPSRETYYAAQPNHHHHHHNNNNNNNNNNQTILNHNNLHETDNNNNIHNINNTPYLSPTTASGAADSRRRPSTQGSGSHQYSSFSPSFSQQQQQQQAQAHLTNDRKSMPPTAPPRSSSQYGASATAGRRDGYSSGSHRSSSANGRYEDSSRRHSFVPGQDHHQQRSSSRQRESSAAPGTRGQPAKPSREATEALTRAIGGDAPVTTTYPQAGVVSADMEVGQPQPQQQQQQQQQHHSQQQQSGHHHHHAQQPHEGGRRHGRRGHDPNKRERVSRLGDYILGSTIGEGEFGKVKLGWKQSEGGAGNQYAIKLIKKDILGENPNRLAKIWREVAILRRVSHPNIVRLIDTQDRERYIGIILEYASGGELFDFILSQRCLKENVARRLFAQLVSGVGYLHKKGIVHRDLKLENLLLDSNRNIIITDFGFANTFDPDEDLTEEEELNLSDKDWVKKVGLDVVKKNGSRKGDLMQTSCGSPCYAAPELVISDSLYTGRKVDVWSCGVILYAMLAGYLPFDDDPANPEGDNINQLYRYIVSTPLTFPEPVSPGARDLLRRILVPNPRKRADLFEVARHSWLSEFADVVEFITSSSTSPREIQNSTVPAEELADIPLVTRSTSVREASRTKAPPPQVVGGLGPKQGHHLDPEEAAAYAKQQKDAKRRTVQVEYVAPQTQTRRGDGGHNHHHNHHHHSTTTSTAAPAAPSSGTATMPAAAIVVPGSRTRSGRPSIEITPAIGRASMDKPLPDPPSSRDGRRSRDGRSRSNNNTTNNNNTTSRSTRDPNRMAAPAPAPQQRSASNTSQQSMGIGHVPQGQPAPPEVAGTVAHGSIQQPTTNDLYEEEEAPAPPHSGVPPKFAKVAGFENDEDAAAQAEADKAAHRRSNTFGDLSRNLLGRSGSLFGSGRGKRTRAEGREARKYPPVSMTNAIASNAGGENSIRQSIDSRLSRRSLSLAFGRKRSGSFVGSQHSVDKRRFSFLPHSFSAMIGLSGQRDSVPPSGDTSQQDLPIQDPADAQYTTAPTPTPSQGQGDESRQPSSYSQQPPSSSYGQQPPSSSYGQSSSSSSYHRQPHHPRPRVTVDPAYAAPRISMSTSTPVIVHNRPSMQVDRRPPPSPLPASSASFHHGPAESSFNDSRQNVVYEEEPVQQHVDVGSEVKAAGLQKHKRFSEAYDERGRGFGATRRVMAWFRVRGRERAEAR